MWDDDVRCCCVNTGDWVINTRLEFEWHPDIDHTPQSVFCGQAKDVLFSVSTSINRTRMSEELRMAMEKNMKWAESWLLGIQPLRSV